jgi:hypothetical protein
MPTRKELAVTTVADSQEGVLLKVRIAATLDSMHHAVFLAAPGARRSETPGAE